MPGETGENRKSFDNDYFSQRTDVLNIVLDYVTHGMVVVGLDYRTLAFNRHFEEMFQLPPGTVEVGIDFREILKIWANETGQDQQMLARAIYQLDEPATFEFEFPQMINGIPRWCLLTHNPIPGKGFVRTFTDITERKRTEEALRESELRFHHIFQDVSSIAVQGYSPDGTTQFWNQASERLYGYSAQEAIGRNLLELIIPPEMQEGVKQAIRYMAETGQPIPVSELSLMRKDGSRVSVFSSHTIVKVPGREQELFCLDIDLTESKRAEANLRNKERYQRALLDNFPFAVWLKDTESRFLAVNQVFADTFSVHAPDELLGKTDFDIAPHDMAEGYRTDDRAVLLSRQKKTVEEEIIDGGVRKWFHTYKAPVIAESGELLGTVGFFRDITEQKESEKDHLKIEKLESLGILAGGIAHDFNNILTGIIGNISFAQNFVDADHKAFKPLNAAEKASMRAGELAQQLLTFSKGGEPIKQVLSVQQIVNESVSLVLHGSNVKGIVEIPDSIHAIEADEGQMSQIFHNIIINATQAMPGGGTLTIAAQNETLGDNNRSSLPPGAYICLTFADQGCGITDDDLKRIFDPYFTTKLSGNGLGLASAHSIISRHGGYIGASSTKDKGTTFTIYLQSIGTTYEKYRTDSVRLTSGEHTGGSILVMDDEEIIRNLASDMLEYFGYQVTTCANGVEAIKNYKAAKESGSPFSAVIMDLTIPGGMGGQEAANGILSIDPKACLIVSSGYSNNSIMSNFRSFGFRGTLSKPYKMTEVGQLLSSLLSE
jgi:PAS domain S-box-containing protein